MVNIILLIRRSDGMDEVLAECIICRKCGVGKREEEREGEEEEKGGGGSL